MIWKQVEVGNRVKSEIGSIPNTPNSIPKQDQNELQTPEYKLSKIFV